MKAHPVNIPAEHIVEMVREPLVVLDADLRVLSANRSFYRTFRLTPEQTERQRLYDLDNQQWDIPALHELLERILPKCTTMQNFEVEHDFETIGHRVMLLNAQQIPEAPKKAQMLLLTIEDITEQKQAEQEALRIEHFYEQVLNELPIQLAVLDLDFRYRYLNACSISDPEFRQWLIGKTDLDYCHRRGVDPELADRRQAWYREVIASKESSSFEETLQTPSGEERHLRRVASPTLGSDGEVVQLVGYGLDITEQKRAEAETKRLKEFYENVLDKLSLQIAIFDLEGRFLYVNPAGLSDPEARRWVIGKTEADFMRKTGRPASLAQTRMAHLHRAVTEGELVIFEERFPARSGETMAFKHSYCPMIDPDGEVAKVIGYRYDITEHMQAEQELRKNEEKYRSLFEHASDAIFIVEMPTARILKTNEKAAELVRYTEDELCQLTVFDLDPPEDRPRIAAVIQQVLEEGSAVFEHRLVRKDGSEIPVEISTRLIAYEGSQALQSFIRDISERKLAEQEREDLIEELEAKNAELERFTYTVSHDLKSPLVTIKGFLGVLQQDAARGDTEGMNRAVALIAGAADKMARLLDELLELSRIGRQVNPPEAVSLTELAREAVDLVAGHIVARGVAVEIDPALPVVYGDRVRLLEVYQNLLANAIKFMGDQTEPRVRIGARQHGSEVLCFVRDNGIGIAPKYHEKVFGLFDSLDPGSDGTGIGLALVKRIVEVHGGRIWIESEGEGRGSTFCFTFPKRP